MEKKNFGRQVCSMNYLKFKVNLSQIFQDNSITVTPKCGNTLASNTCIEPEDVFCSNNGIYTLTIISSGNFVIYQKVIPVQKQIWTTKLASSMRSIAAYLSPDGYFTLYDKDWSKVWFTRMSSSNMTGAYGVIEDSENFVIYSGNKEKIWSTGLNQRS